MPKKFRFLLVAGPCDDPWRRVMEEAADFLGALRIVREIDALRLTWQNHYDLIVIDSAKVQDVFLLVSSIRIKRPDAKIVVATASPTWEHAREAFRAGAIDYVQKSMNKRKMLATLRGTMEKACHYRGADGAEEGTGTTKAIILFADNDPDFLKTRSEFLEQKGYQVIPALEPEEAIRIIEQGQADLAVIDMRLIDDDDEKDLSGLRVANESISSIPKVILTRFPTVEAVREALGPAVDGLAPTVDFVAKQEGPQALLTTVRKALK